MATEKQARQAREEHFDRLRNLGAHTLAVDAVEEKGKKTFGIIAFVEGDASRIPDHVELTTGNKKTKVPVRIESSTRFQPE